MPDLKNMLGQHQKEEEENEEINTKKVAEGAQKAINTAAKTAKGVVKVVRWIAALPIAVKIVLAATVVITALGTAYSIFHLVTDDNSSKNNPEKLYDMIASKDKNLHDLITIAGDSSSGYYLAFKQGAEERIDEIVKEFSKPNYQTITNMTKEALQIEDDGNKDEGEINREILLKLIEAELVTQYPNLGGTIGQEADVKIAQDSKEQYDATQKMEIPKIYKTQDTSGYASVAMVLSYLKDEDIKEEDVYNWAIKSQFEDGYFSGDEGEEKFFEESAKEWDAGEVMKIENKFVVIDALKAGRPVIARVNHTSNYLFTNAVDYIVLRGVDEDEKSVYVNNANKEKSEGIIDFEKDIHSEAECYFIYNSKKALEEAEETKNSSNDTNDSNTSTTAENLDGFLFVGDSITDGLSTNGGIKDKVTFVAKTGVGSNYWIENFNKIEEVKDVKGVNVFLGTNDWDWGLDNLKNLLEKIHKQFTSVPIYVDGLLPDNQPGVNKTDRDNFTKNVKAYCEEKDYLTFVDASAGVKMQENGFHPTTEGYKTLANNLKDAILRGKTEPTNSIDSDSNKEKLLIAEDTGEGLDGFQGAIRIRRITPNKTVGELKNVGAGSESTVDEVSGKIAGNIKSYLDQIKDGKWSVYAQNLNTGEVEANIKGNKKLQSASVIKLFILAAAYQEMEDGKEIDKEQLKVMITESSNDAANYVIDTLGFKKINKWIKDNGYSKKTTLDRKFRKPIIKWR